MTITMDAYKKLDFVRDSIDLLCTGVSWRGGKFSSTPPISDTRALRSLSEQDLVFIVKAMLLEGKAYVSFTASEDGFSIRQNRSEGEVNADSMICIERVESAFSPRGIPILERVKSSIDRYQDMVANLPINPALLDPIKNITSTIHSALAIPFFLLDTARVNQKPVEALMMGALQFQAEVESLRWNLRAGLDEVGFQIAEKMDLKSVVWDWNEEWKVSGPCKYGHVYQVFQSRGIVLDPIKNSELGGMKQALQAGLISNKTYNEYAASYGLK